MSNADKWEEKLSAQGWNISPAGLKILTNDGALNNYQAILQNALDSDLKEISKPVLSTPLSKFIEDVVLQIQKLRNISAPKANEDSQAAPRMLKLTLTDGHTHCQAIEVDNISGLNLNRTPPGTKIRFKGIAVVNGFLLVSADQAVVLGGRVPALYEKWEVNRNISNYKRGSEAGTDGPPAWVNFGKRIAGSESKDKDFRSLEDKTKGDDGKPTEFDMQRTVAIEAAATGAVKKVFGGGLKPTLNGEPRRERDNRSGEKERTERTMGGRPERRNRREPKDKADVMEARPSGKVSLFAFLEDKLPEKPASAPVAETVPPINYYNESDYSYNARGADSYRPNQRRQAAPPPRMQARNSYQPPVSQPQSRHYNQYQEQPPQQQQQQRQTNQCYQSQQNDFLDDLPNKMNRLNVNASFAKNAFKNHLGLQTSPPPTSGGTSWKWHIGDLCMAKYWEDNKYYNATITGLTDRTCVVRFPEYGNVEEVLFEDCLPVSGGDEEEEKPAKYSNGNSNNDYRGNRNFVNRNYRRNQNR